MICWCGTEHVALRLETESGPVRVIGCPRCLKEGTRARAALEGAIALRLEPEIGESVSGWYPVPHDVEAETHVALCGAETSAPAPR